MVHHNFNFGISGCHELCNIPLAARSQYIGENSAECIPFREIFLIILKLVEIHEL